MSLEWQALVGWPLTSLAVTRFTCGALRLCPSAIWFSLEAERTLGGGLAAPPCSQTELRLLDRCAGAALSGALEWLRPGGPARCSGSAALADATALALADATVAAASSDGRNGRRPVSSRCLTSCNCCIALTLATVPPHPPGNRLQLLNSVGWPNSDTKQACSVILDDASPRWEEQARGVQWRYARPKSYRRTARGSRTEGVFVLCVL